ncbi:B3/B4 domain-containing protein [Clostridium perfringens]|uniref:B3/B4 domain-containing protein n=1 Tax=Clostridium perfringens TaxID=1502 RepID=UPI0028CCCC46|nr:B3/4 domain-containing protein [Clostridium perfringens]MDT7917249.1 B3/4 domain-containing protein [Clostridium perfringens]MDT7935820.1 B3/4 domain-containing protein [Clostridium perfringens]MDT7938966.1 B3/4 domain-containing protein [Clostridium perfringens]MDT7965978.1 B3/4 domain-containing protein [Clostridium perfringens]MDT7990670.1 B3/4 domain-containing protein [Clostridium perfringens]
MKKFIIEDDFWELFPNAKIGIITCNGIDNTIKDENQYKDMISQGEKEALNHLPNEEFSSNEVIKVWRDAFKKFKTKKGARSSIEALLKRVSTGKGLGTINPLVDIYNSISLKYAMPCGGEDMDKFIGDIRLTKATGDESFITLGSDKSEPPYEGEIVYKDDEGAICRCWNWRESVRTMLTEDTKNAFLCIELVDEKREKDFENALKELSQLVEENLGGKSEVSILHINNKEAII